ncbi:type III secretion system export apparatus subunit SctU [Celeribacter sp.]|uniref:type III secretion system export apparatus subunit SctU n=1 Tax=Celeribacter sp. TaxID=1890673 RepID=UPI003A8F6299
MSGEKTEKPTPKKERDARQKGQVARSQEVVTTVSLFGVIAVIWLMGGMIWEKLVAIMDIVAGLAARNDDMALQNGLAATFNMAVSIMLPILGVVMAFGIAANYVQVGSLFSLQAIQPKLEKISPAKGVKRIFSMKQVVEMLKSIFKILFLSLLLYIVLKEAIGPFLSSISCGTICVWAVTKVVTLKLLMVSAVAFVVVAGLDFMYQRHSHTKSLMMSKDDVKREYKESEGDPVVKGQRKQLARELVMSDVKKQVPQSSAVVVNPTHLAVAIRYEEGETLLPIVVAKGREKIAQEIRMEAELAGVPIFCNVPLARSLYADTPVDGYVSDEAFTVVAEILAWVKAHEAELYQGPLKHGDLDMEREDHKAQRR